MALKMKEMGLTEGIWMPTGLLQPRDAQAVPQMGIPCLQVPLCSTALSFKENEPCSKADLPCNSEKMCLFTDTTCNQIGISRQYKNCSRFY